MEYKRGCVVNVNFGKGVGSEKNGFRPAVILSSDEIINNSSPNIIVAPITGVEHKMSNNKPKMMVSHVYLSSKYYKELKKDSIIQLEDIRSISKKRVGKHVTCLSDESLAIIEARLDLLLK